VTQARPGTTLLSRVERFASVGSTNDVVRGWLASGTPEVCLAVAGEQTAGRGRHGRSWTAPAGAALLLSAGFRPAWLPAARAWRVAATVALAMCAAGEDVAGLPVGSIRLKWPNDLVIETAGPNALLVGSIDASDAAERLAAPVALRKLAGVLGESDGLGTPDPRVVVGVGINADWAPADFPPELAGAMSSLREASGGRPIDLDALLDAFAGHLEMRVLSLRDGFFDLADWTARQATTGRQVVLDGAGVPGTPVRAVGVDAVTGALAIEDPSSPSGERHVHAGEVVHVRLSGPGV
jgi:BirA family biotin operon repressor/biotin-[acetyl-CoA-carboxylase] ligase